MKEIASEKPTPLQEPSLPLRDGLEEWGGGGGGERLRRGLHVYSYG